MSALRELFDELVELDAAGREARMAEIADGRLRAQLRALLEADDSDSELPSHAEIASMALPAGTLVGQRIGVYELVALIGAGGMGDVYLGRRVDGEFEQEVAVKIVRRHLSSPSTINRFRSERQLLARLNHPSIARLFDGGVTDSGRPYLIMEFVDGKTIDEYCSAGKLEIDRRLELFIRACEAVQHAHENLIVHCDLKPDNILITEGGELKLLDFGIATVLSDDGDGGGGRAMTPEYAAPEMFERQPLSAATDVYSLGVILYQLLVGRVPVELASLPRGERLAKIRGANIEAPSSRHPVSSDLDAICLRALATDPQERYRSAHALAGDVRRHLDHRPVEARAPTLSYRVRKFLRRNTLAVTAVALVTVLTAAIVLFYALRLADERDRAQAQARRAQAASNALLSVFTAADPATSQGEPITSAQLLATGRAEIEKALVGERELLAEMLAALAQVNHSLGHYKEAESLLARALELERKQAAKSRRVAHALALLGETLREQSRHDEAETAIQSALEIYRDLDGSESLAVARALLGLRNIEDERGNAAKGLELAERARAIQREQSADAVTIATTLHAIASSQSQLGDYGAAEKNFREAYESYRAAHGDLHPATATALADLAHALRKQARYDEAEPLYRKALEVREQLFEGDHPDVAYNINHLGRLLFQKGAIAASIPVLRRALAMRRRLYGKKHAAVSASLGALSQALVAAGELEEAEALSREGLEIVKALHSPDHPYVAGMTANVARVVNKQGRTSDAIALFEEAVAIGRKSHEARSPRLAGLLSSLGAAMCSQKPSREARAILGEAEAIQLEKLGAEHPALAKTRQALKSCD